MVSLYGVLRVWLLASVGSMHFSGPVFATCVVLATFLAGSLLEWSPGLRRHPFFAGTALAWVAFYLALSFATCWDALVSGRDGLETFLGLGFMGATVVAPVALPLGWGLVLFSRIEADWWDARAQT